MSYETLSILKFKQRNFVDHIQKTAGDSTELMEAAIQYAESTHDFLMLNREDLQASEGRLFLSQNFKSLYESALIALHLYYEKTGDISAIAKARKFFALSKSILFLEQSGELGEIQDSRLSIDTKKEFFLLKTRIDELEQKFYRLLDQVSTSDSLRKVNSELLNLDTQLKAFKDSLNTVFGLNKNLKTFDGTKVLRETEIDSDKALIEFFVGDEYAFALCVSQNQSIFLRIMLDEKFDRSFERMLSRITNKPRISSHLESVREYQVDAFYIYELLLKDILENLDKGISRLTIVPDEQLAKLPFEALVTDTIMEAKGFDKLKYLLENYTINYSFTSQDNREQKLNRTADKDIFGIGFSGSVDSELRSGFGALPGTEEELEFLKANFDGDYFLGKDGTRETFMESARDYDVLHLAVHGSADSSDRYEASLIFNGERGSNVLKTSDLYLADLRARLAILSACESGVGEINRGEGTFSIARGFALVGVPSVIMSLWKVNDKMAAELMVGLHGNLKEGYFVDEALTKTKREYLLNADEYTSHPYYWSAFVSLGENVKLDSGISSNKEILIVLLLFILVSALVTIALLKKRKGAV